MIFNWTNFLTHLYVCLHVAHLLALELCLYFIIKYYFAKLLAEDLYTGLHTDCFKLQFDWYSKPELNLVARKP